METVKYIFQKPDIVDGIGEIFPIKMKHYDEFMNSTNILCLSYDHFNVDEIKKDFGLAEVTLFELIILAASQSADSEESFFNLANIFSFATRKNIKFIDEDVSFVTDDGMYINKFNYEKVREIIMKQNLLFTPKVYKNKKLQEWANKVIQARAKNGIDSTIEDMISTIAVISCKDYETLEEYSIYQVKQEFNRVIKVEAYRSALAYKVAGAEKVDLEHYVENIDMFKNPYDDLFKEKSKLKNFNAVSQGG